MVVFLKYSTFQSQECHSLHIYQEEPPRLHELYLHTYRSSYAFSTLFALSFLVNGGWSKATWHITSKMSASFSAGFASRTASIRIAYSFNSSITACLRSASVHVCMNHQGSDSVVIIVFLQTTEHFLFSWFCHLPLKQILSHGLYEYLYH